MSGSVEPAVATAYHEAGHALARYLVHGSTGPVAPAPFPDKEAGAEMEPLPPELLDGTRLVPGPYSAVLRNRLVQEVKTGLGGCVAEAILLRRDPLEVLDNEPSLESDRSIVFGVGGSLWLDTEERDREIEALATEMTRELQARWATVERIATAYLEGPLTATQVRELVDPPPVGD
jgi:hypothetical protein